MWLLNFTAAMCCPTEYHFYFYTDRPNTLEQVSSYFYISKLFINWWSCLSRYDPVLSIFMPNNFRWVSSESPDSAESRCIRRTWLRWRRPPRLPTLPSRPASLPRPTATRPSSAMPIRRRRFRSIPSGWGWWVAALYVVLVSHDRAFSSTLYSGGPTVASKLLMTKLKLSQGLYTKKSWQARLRFQPFTSRATYFVVSTLKSGLSLRSIISSGLAKTCLIWSWILLLSWPKTMYPSQ